MSQANIRKAFEKKLISVCPANSIAFEAVDYTPKNGTPYHSCRLVPATVQNPTLGDNYHREVGIFSVVLHYPLGVGSQQAAARAEELKLIFHRNLTIVEANTEVNISKTPSIGSGYVDNGRYCIPIRIQYYTNEFS